MVQDPVTARTIEHAVTLYTEHRGFVEGLSSRYGRLTVVDRWDIRQVVFISAVVTASEVAHGEFPAADASKRFFRQAHADARKVFTENKYPTKIPFDTYQRVVKAVKAHQDDWAAARRYLTEQAPAHVRLSGSTFDDVYAVAQGIYISCEGAADLTDDAYRMPAPDPYATIDDRDAVRYALSLLTPRQREVVARSYGLEGHVPQTQSEIAVELGETQPAICRILGRALSRMQVHAEDLR